MENQIALETAEILKRLSPQNQAYFMTIARVVEATERNVKALMRKFTPSARTEHPGGDTQKQCALF